MSPSSNHFEIIKINQSHFVVLWPIIEPIVREGQTYAIASDCSYEEACEYWFRKDNLCYAAFEDRECLGTYYLRPNQSGGGMHIANAGYMVAQTARGKGVARQMCVHSMKEAQRLGYKAMQFNFVVSTNHVAVALWEKLGFSVIGVIPEGFNHPLKGYVDALVMYQKLS